MQYLPQTKIGPPWQPTSMSWTTSSTSSTAYPSQRGITPSSSFQHPQYPHHPCPSHLSDQQTFMPLEMRVWEDPCHQSYQRRMACRAQSVATWVLIVRAMPPLRDENGEEVADNVLPDAGETPILNEVVKEAARHQAQKRKASFPAVRAKQAQLE